MTNRSIRRRRSGAAAASAAAALVLAAAGTAHAADTTLPVGQADGVRIVHRGASAAVVFSKRAERLYRRVAGKRVAIACTRLSRRDSGAFDITEASSSSQDVRVPKLRRPLRIGGSVRRADYCRVWLPQRTVRDRIGRYTSGPEPLVAIPLTQRGAVHLDEEHGAQLLFGVLSIASFDEDGKPASPDFLSSAALLDLAKREGGRAARDIVALASPADTPPAGKVGYYSDGRRHAAAVTVSASGRRLFVESLPDEELRSNVLRYLFSGDDIS